MSILNAIFALYTFCLTASTHNRGWVCPDKHNPENPITSAGQGALVERSRWIKQKGGTPCQKIHFVFQIVIHDLVLKQSILPYQLEKLQECLNTLESQSAQLHSQIYSMCKEKEAHVQEMSTQHMLLKESQNKVGTTGETAHKMLVWWCICDRGHYCAFFWWKSAAFVS